MLPLRVEAGDEGLGLDVTQHGEEAYTRGEGAILVLPELEAPADRGGRAAQRGRRPRMKLVVAVIRQEKLNDVLVELFKAEVQGLTISEVRGHGGEMEQVETYRGTTVKMALSEKVRLEIGVSDHFVEPTVQGDPPRRPHGAGRRRQDLRPPGREDLPDSHRRRRSGRGDAGHRRVCLAGARRPQRRARQPLIRAAIRLALGGPAGSAEGCEIGTGSGADLVSNSSQLGCRAVPERSVDEAPPAAGELPAGPSQGRLNGGEPRGLRATAAEGRRR